MITSLYFQILGQGRRPALFLNNGLRVQILVPISEEVCSMGEAKAVSLDKEESQPLHRRLLTEYGCMLRVVLRPRMLLLA